MKTKILTVLLILYSIHSFSQEWYSSNPRARDINSVIMKSPDEIIMVGGNQFNDSIQSIITSANQGLIWDLRSDDISSWLKSIAFVDSLNGFAVGFNGKILKTVDGGDNWVSLNSPNYMRHFNKVIFVDSLTAFIAGGRQQNDSIQTILKSVDGGNSWNIIYDQLGHWLKSIYFIDSLKGVAVGDEGVILQTTDGGTSWLPLISPIQRDFNAITFINDSVGYIVGGNQSNDSVRTILQTTDGGTNWTILKDELGGWLTDVYFLNKDTGYISGYQATLLKTIDGGFTWLPEMVNGTAGDESFNTVRFLNDHFGVIAGRYGKVFIYTISSLPQAQTTGHLVNVASSVDLFGKVSTNGYPGVFYFVFSTDSMFSNTGQTYPQLILSDSLTPVVTSVTNFAANTIYYYHIVAETYKSASLGESQVLYTYQETFTINTLTASEVTNNSARLNAEASSLPLQATLSFEYGLDSTLGNEIAAVPNSINDTSAQPVAVILNGLQTNTLYYYRIKGSTSIGTKFYGEIKQVYTGTPIPNWDFQLWEEDTIELPYDWSVLGDNVEKVSGYSGNFALKLFKSNITLMGKLLGDGDSSGNLMYDGMPFNARPDSLAGFFNYNIATGDTAYIFIQFTNNGAPVAFQLCPIAGSSGGNFERLSWSISYDSPLIPDTLAIGIVTLNPFDTLEIDFSNNNLIIDDIEFIPSSPAILNSGFENWLDYSFKSLESWNYFKHVYIDNVARNDTLMVTQTFFQEPSDYAAEIRNIKSGDRGYLQADISQEKPKALFEGDGPYFPVYARHQTLNGYFQFYPVNGDTMEISVEMFNQGVRIGMGGGVWADSVTSFQPFEIPIMYDNSLVPDSGSIKLGISTTYGLSKFIIDKLTFDGFVLSNDIGNNVPLNPVEESIKVYPNPAKSRVIIETFFQRQEKYFIIQLIDLNGRILKQFTAPGIQSRIEMDITGLPPGFFILQINSDYGTFNKKMIVLN